MKDTAKKRGQHLVLNGASLAAPLIGAIISVPILLRHLDPAAFSLLGMYWVIIGYASIVELGMGRSVTRQISIQPDAIDNGHNEIVAVGVITALSLGLIAGLFLLLILPYIFGNLIYIPAELRADNAASIRWIALAVPALVCTSVFNGALEARKRFGWMACVKIPAGLALFVVPAVLAASGYELPDLLLGIVAVRFVLVIVLAIQVQYEFPGALSQPRFAVAKVGELLSFGGWLTISAVIGPVLVYLDRFVISAQYGLEASAVYTAPFEAVIRFLVIASAVTGVMFPRFVAASKSDSVYERRLFFEANAYVAVGILPAALAFIFVGKPLFSLWLGASGLPSTDIDLAASLAAILSIGLFVNACAHVPQALVQAHGFARWTALLHVAELIGYLLYAPRIIAAYGLHGAAYAWLIRSLISAMVLYFLSIRLLRNGYKRV